MEVLLAQNLKIVLIGIIEIVLVISYYIFKNNFFKAPTPLNCSRYSSCVECLNDPSEGCGWCASNYSCLEIAKERKKKTCTKFIEDVCIGK